MISLYFILNSENQGQVMTQVSENYYMCDFFSWFDGRHTHSALLNFDDFKNCIFFQDKELFENYIRNNKKKLG